MRIRIFFAKTAAMRYTGHLDLHRTWERTFRRARLPLSYSHGFNPHPHLALGAALPLGFTSQNELLDAWLDEDLPLNVVHTALEPALPPGIHVQHIEEVGNKLPALQAQMLSAEYEITLLDPLPDLDARIQRVLEAESLPRRRRDKLYDLRLLIETLTRLEDNPDGQARLFARLSARESATGRPEEMLAEMGITATQARIHRTRLLY